MLIKECNKVSVLSTKEYLPLDKPKHFLKTVPGVVSQPKAEWQLAPCWGMWCMEKQRLCVRDAPSLTSPPAGKHWKNRQNLVGWDRALKQLRGPFHLAWLQEWDGNALWFWPHLGLQLQFQRLLWLWLWLGVRGAPVNSIFFILKAASWAHWHCLSAPIQKCCRSEEQGRDCQWQRGTRSAKLAPETCTHPPWVLLPASASSCRNHVPAMMWVVWN